MNPNDQDQVPLNPVAFLDPEILSSDFAAIVRSYCADLGTPAGQFNLSPSNLDDMEKRIDIFYDLQNEVPTPEIPKGTLPTLQLVPSVRDNLDHTTLHSKIVQVSLQNIDDNLDKFDSEFVRGQMTNLNGLLGGVTDAATKNLVIDFMNKFWSGKEKYMKNLTLMRVDVQKAKISSENNMKVINHCIDGLKSAEEVDVFVQPSKDDEIPLPDVISALAPSKQEFFIAVVEHCLNPSLRDMLTLTADDFNPDNWTYSPNKLTTELIECIMAYHKSIAGFAVRLAKYGWCGLPPRKGKKRPTFVSSVGGKTYRYRENMFLFCIGASNVTQNTKEGDEFLFGTNALGHPVDAEGLEIDLYGNRL